MKKLYLILLVCLVLGAGCWVLNLWWRSVGLVGKYVIEQGGETRVMATQIDKGINFVSLLRLRGPYWSYWSTRRDGFPENEVRPEVNWSGYMNLREETTVEMVGPVTATAMIDGQMVTATRSAMMAAGIHEVKVDYEYQSEGDELMLMANKQPVTPLALYPDQVSIGRRSGYELILVVGVMVIMGGLIWGWRRENTRQELLRVVMEPRVWVVVIMLVGAILRLYQHDLYPPLHETEDEQGLAWHGISLLTTGTPTSWLFYDYFNPKQVYTPDRLQSLKWFGADFTLGTPYFDNPPVMPILLGLVSVAAGAKTIFDSHLEVIRLIPIMFGVVNIWLVYVWGERVLKSKKIGLAAAFFYSLTPLIVVANRVVKEENMLATFFLLIGLAVYEYVKNKRGRYLVWAGVWSGLAFLTKETSVVGLIAAAVMVWQWPKKWQVKELLKWPIIKLLMVMAPFVVFYFVYGIGWSLGYQWASFEVNTHKILDVVSWLRLFTDHHGAAIGSFAFFFYPLMLINLFISSSKMDKFSQLTVSLYLLLMGALIYGTDWGFFGWYKTAVYPFLALAMGITVVEGMMKTDEVGNYLQRLMVPLVTIIAGSYYPLVRWNLTGNKVVVYAITLVSLVYVLVPHVDRKLRYGVTYGLLVMFAVSSVVTIVFQEQFYFMGLKF